MHKSKLYYYEQYYFLIVSLFKEMGIKLNTSDVMKYLKGNQKSSSLNDYRATISGHLSDLREQGILCCNEKKGRGHAYYLNTNVDIDNYLSEKASKFLQIWDVDITNVYDECNAEFDYLELEKTIFTYSQVNNLVNEYGRKLIYCI